jgi:acyl-CoA synthetase (AMP-forming)/AMP-acid ligase II
VHVTTDRGTATVVDAFLATVEAGGDAPAILDADVKVALSWRDYGSQARRAAAGLAALGLGRHETVGLLLRNRPEFQWSQPHGFMHVVAHETETL